MHHQKRFARQSSCKKLKERKTLIIAEAGVNHNGSIDTAKKMIDVAAEAGADLVKFQTFKAEELNTETAPKSTYHVETTGRDEDQSWFELLKTQEISREMQDISREI